MDFERGLDQGESLGGNGFELGKGGVCHGQSHLLPGPSPEWLVSHTLTPGDLRELRVEPVVTKSSSILMNISWILRADGKFASIKVKVEMCRLCDPFILILVIYAEEYIHTCTQNHILECSS